MDWLYPYIPSLFAIFVVFLTPALSGYLRLILQCHPTDDKQLRELLTEDDGVIPSIILDWGERVGFLNAMIASLGSPFAIYSASHSVGWTLTTLIVLLVLYLCVFLWMLPKEAGSMLESAFPLPHLLTRLLGSVHKSRTVHKWPIGRPTISYGHVIRITIVVANAILILAIYFTEKLS
jgi:hypothetical protein